MVADGGRISEAARAFAERAAAGLLELQACDACGVICWPPRDLCPSCWSDDLRWRKVAGDGALLSSTVIRSSLDPYFRAAAPWTIGTVRLDAGPVVTAHLASGLADGARVRLIARRDRFGYGVLIALRPEAADLEDEPKLRALVAVQSTREEP